MLFMHRADSCSKPTESTWSPGQTRSNRWARERWMMVKYPLVIWETLWKYCRLHRKTKKTPCSMSCMTIAISHNTLKHSFFSLICFPRPPMHISENFSSKKTRFTQRKECHGSISQVVQSLNCNCVYAEVHLKLHPVWNLCCGSKWIFIIL